MAGVLGQAAACRRQDTPNGEINNSAEYLGSRRTGIVAGTRLLAGSFTGKYGAARVREVRGLAGIIVQAAAVQCGRY